MLEIIVVYSDKDQIKDLASNSNITLLNTVLDKKKAFQLKGAWGARLDPFAVIKENGNVIKAFYSEAQNVIEELNKYLNE